MKTSKRLSEKNVVAPFGSKSKIREDDFVSLFGEQHVLALDVSMHPTFAMHVVQCKDHLSKVSSRGVLFHWLALSFLHHLEEIAAAMILGHEHSSVLVLKVFFEMKNIWRLESSKRICLFFGTCSAFGVMKDLDGNVTLLVFSKPDLYIFFL